MVSMSGLIYVLLGLWLLPGVVIVTLYLYELGRDIGRHLRGKWARPLPSFGHVLENACDRQWDGAQASVHTLSVERVKQPAEGGPSAERTDPNQVHQWTLYLN